MGDSQPMYYGELHPRPELKPWIAAHWHFRVEPDVPARDHWIPLNGGVMLAIPAGHEPMLTGPRTEPQKTRVRGGDRVWGSIFWPGAAPSLLGVDVKALRSGQIPARFVLGDDVTEMLKERFTLMESEEDAAELLDAVLLDRLPPSRPLDEKIMLAVFRLLQSGGEVAVSEVAAAIGLSPRQMRRRFRREVGLSPKQLARIQRLRSSAVEAVFAQDEPWVTIAANRGYSDQAHLIREFRGLLGVTPSGFEDHFQRIRHGRLIR